MKASVIIPTLNREKILKETLGYFQKMEGDFEIIIVDQSDISLSEADLKNIDSRIKIIRSEVKNLPHARNRGAEESSSEILIYIDDDVNIQSDNFVKVHISMYKDSNVGAVAGRVKQPWEAKTVSIVGGIHKPLYIIGGSFNCEKEQLATGFIGCNFSVRKSVWQKIGGFDENFSGSANLEESEFAIRVMKSGYNIIFSPSAFLLHLAQKTGGVRNEVDKIAKARYWIMKNHMYVFSKHGSWIFFTPFVLILKLRAVWYGFKDRSFNSSMQSFEGIWSGFKDYFLNKKHFK